MKCVRCKKECLSDELINGYCYECRKYLGVDEKNVSSLKYQDVKNDVGQKISITCLFIKYGGIALSTIGALVYIYEFRDNFLDVILGIIAGLFGISTSYFIGLLLEALAEIINLLQNIRNK